MVMFRRRSSLLGVLLILGCGSQATDEQEVSLDDVRGVEAGAGSADDTCIDGVLRWGWGSPAASFAYESQIDPCSTFTHKTISLVLGPSASCTQDLVSIPGGIDTRAIHQALAASDVQASFTEPPTFYGGGSALRIEWGDATVNVGYDCTDLDPEDPNCDIPEGLEALRDLLDQITREQLEHEPCSNSFDGPSTLVTPDIAPNDNSPPDGGSCDAPPLDYCDAAAGCSNLVITSENCSMVAPSTCGRFVSTHGVSPLNPSADSTTECFDSAGVRIGYTVESESSTARHVTGVDCMPTGPFGSLCPDAG